MKKTLLYIILFSMVSCSSPLSKKFNPNTYGADIAEIEVKLSKNDKELIGGWVSKHSPGGNSLEINGLTYEQILEKAKQDKKELQQKIDNFYNTKFTSGDKFIKDIQKLVDDNVLNIDNYEVECISFFCSYKEKEGTVFKMNYKQIFNQAPAFCKEKENQ